MRRVLVCGGRYYKDSDILRRVLSALHANKPFAALIEGGALGADRLAREWAQAASVPVETFEANWALHGRAGGPIRNGRMLSEGKPDIVVAFPGGSGTADMIKQARAAHVYVLKVGERDVQLETTHSPRTTFRSSLRQR